eukprot:m51a1_g9386 hypothetical protein (492) ;mRNA; f:229843-231447
MSDHEHDHAEHEEHDHCGCDSCGEDDDMEDVATHEDKVGDEVSLTSDGGIKKKILRVGTGFQKPPKESEVTVHYVGTLTDGTEFDSSRGRGEPFTFKLGVGQVIKGWDTGVASMKKGELALLTCTAPYAYGDAGSPPKIPGGATLNFEVELLSWVDEKDVSPAKDGSLMKKTLKDGEGWEMPGEEASVTLAYVARDQAGKELERSPEGGVTFDIGEEQAPSRALDVVVQNMKKGETVQLTAAPSQTGRAETVVYEATLVDYKKPKMVYEMTGPELLESSEKRRLEGNELYKAGKLARALRRYKKALEFLDADYKFSDEEKKKSRPGKVPCYLNIAACKMATKEYKDAVDQCTKALEIESQNTRALVRRGKSYVALDDWDAAERDFAHVLEIDPANADAQRESAALKHKRAEVDRKLKSRMQGMFSRMAQLEEEEAKQRAAEEELLAKQKAAEEEERKKKEAESKPAEEKKEGEEKKPDEPMPAASEPAAAQ